MRYVVRRARVAPGPDDAWDAPAWSCAQELKVEHFHPRGSDHHPETRAKLLHDNGHLYVLFDVRDRYVRCVHTDYQSMVSRDSCVEFFLQPPGQPGYFNFEINCGGAMLLYFIEDATRGKDAPFEKFTPVPESVSAGVRVWHSLPRRVEPEIVEPVEWSLGCAVPLSLFAAFVGDGAPVGGQTWRGNFFKCGDHTSRPHWASWAPIGELLRFHQPDRFGCVDFEP
jgi:hypothetical protein